jgi:PAS domain S-box-containing protein
MQAPSHPSGIISLILLLLLALPLPAQTETTVRIGHEQNHPMVSTGPDGKPRGIMIDIVEEIARQENWAIQYEPCLWNQCLENLEAGAIDLLVAIAHTPERALRFDYNQHTVISNWGMLYRHPDTKIESYADLKGKRIAVVQNDVYCNTLIKMLQQFDIQCDLIFADNFKEIFHMISGGEVDAGVANRFFSLLNERSFKVSSTPVIFSPVSVQVAAPKGKSREILAAFDYHLEGMKKNHDSAYHQSLKRWLEVERGHSHIPRWIWWLVNGVLGGAILLGIFAALLHRQVQSKTADLRHEISERQQSEEQLRLVLNNMQEILAQLSLDGTIIFITHGIELLGYLPADLEGNSFRQLCKNQDDFSILIEELEEKNSVSGFRIQMLNKDGSERLISINADLLRGGANGKPLSIIATGTDITEAVKMDKLMAQTEKMMMVGGLAAGMAHEINNPLGIIIQHIQNIERRLSPDLPANLKTAQDTGIELSRMRDYLEQRSISQFLSQIRQAGDRMSRIISNMLKFSRQSESHMEHASLETVIEQALELAASDYDLKKHYDFKDIDIVRDYTPNLPKVPVITLELEQVLLNLFKNAAQAIAFSKDKKSPRITLRTKQTALWAVIEVEDNGPGMSSEVEKRIFEPFYTTKAVGIGTGLGLSVSYAIITNNHHGHFEVHSHPDSGTCFTISLPLTTTSGDAA